MAILTSLHEKRGATPNRPTKDTYSAKKPEGGSDFCDQNSKVNGDFWGLNLFHKRVKKTRKAESKYYNKRIQNGL